MNMHMTARIFLLMAFILAAGIATPAVASSSAQDTATTQLSVQEVKEAKTEGWLVVKVALVAPDGNPIGDQAVDFYQEANFFGKRPVSLKSATTDATGVATLAFRPAQVGAHSLKATFAGSEQYTAAEISFDVEVTTVVPAVAPREHSPLAPVRRWLSIGVGVLVVGVWMVLLGVMGFVIWGMPRAGRFSESELRNVQQWTATGSDVEQEV